MKIRTNYDKEKGLFALPVIAIGYNYIDKEFTIVFMFACWAFNLEFDFK